MIILKALPGCYSQDPVKYLNFDRFKDIRNDIILIEGSFYQKSKISDFGIQEKELIGKKIVRIELEEPNKYAVNDKPYEYDDLFYKVFTICPYSAQWINEMNKNNRRVATYFPFNEEYIPKTKKKKYDIIYTGHVLCKELHKDIETIKKYNYKFVSNSNDSLVTDKSVSYKKKLDLISQSKITLIHNLIYLNRLYVLNLWRDPHFEKNLAFKDIPRRFNLLSLLRNKNYYAPQIKSRTFEAAFCRSLILCRRDKFNIIEKFFIPEKEFIYYEEGHLSETVDNILKNYSKYKKVIDNAYQKAVKNYTTKNFVEKYLKKLK